MNRFNELSEILNKQMEIHSKLLEIENEKTSILISGDVGALDNLLNIEQPLIMSSSNYEKQRDKLQEEMGIKGLTLRQILEEYPESHILAENFYVMTDLLAELKRVSTRNSKILYSKLDVLNLILTSSGVNNEQPLTYSR